MPKPIAIINVYPTLMKQVSDSLDIRINHELLATLKQQGVRDLILITHQPLFDEFTFFQHRLLEVILEDNELTVHTVVSPGDLINDETVSPAQARYICTTGINTKSFKHKKGTFLTKLKAVIASHETTFTKLASFTTQQGKPNSVYAYIKRHFDIHAQRPLKDNEYYYTYLRHHLAHLRVGEGAAIQPACRAPQRRSRWSPPRAS